MSNFAGLVLPHNQILCLHHFNLRSLCFQSWQSLTRSNYVCRKSDQCALHFSEQITRWKYSRWSKTNCSTINILRMKVRFLCKSPWAFTMGPIFMERILYLALRGLIFWLHLSPCPKSVPFLHFSHMWRLLTRKIDDIVEVCKCESAWEFPRWYIRLLEFWTRLLKQDKTSLNASPIMAVKSPV